MKTTNSINIQKSSEFEMAVVPNIKNTSSKR